VLIRSSVVALTFVLLSALAAFAQPSADLRKSLDAQDCANRCWDQGGDCSSHCYDTTERETEEQAACFRSCTDKGHTCSEACGPEGAKYWDGLEKDYEKEHPENATDTMERSRRRCRQKCNSSSLTCDTDCSTMECMEGCRDTLHACEDACGD
jgi:hypothetical protein